MSKPKRSQRSTQGGSNANRSGTGNTGRSTTTRTATARATGNVAAVNAGRATTSNNRTQARAAYAKSRRRGAPTPWYKTAWATIGGPIVAIALVVTIFVVIATHSGSSGIGRQAVPANVLHDVTTISDQTFSKVGAGELTNPLQQIKPGVPILKDSAGKPIFLYVGAEYCPYCAAERWSMVIALSRFGTFSNLHIISSADAPEVFPDTPTFSFYQSTYTSQYLTFQSVEMQDRNEKSLESLTSAQNAIFTKYDAPPYTQSAGSFPFVDIGNQYVAIGAGYQNDVLTGSDWNSIASALNNPNSPVTQSIVGNANYLTAAICQVTGNKPANVCTAAPIPTLEQAIGKPAGS
jgi:thiol-disulfide isomerase/thioredoxin